MKNQFTLNEICILELVEYIRDIKCFTHNFQLVKEKSFYQKVMNLTVPETLLNDATKGILILYGKDSDVSIDFLRIIQSISYNYIKDNNGKDILSMLEFIKYSIPGANRDKNTLFSFLETMPFLELISKIGFTFTGHSYNIPLKAAALMINRKKVLDILETSKSPMYNIDEMMCNVYDILENENNGEKLYKKINEKMNVYSFKKNDKSA